ncbi:hypothetical protein ZEAMMB73_Zm00001d018746 [Zea mays]|uniref:Uncharacterized protein n=1 Tax=Zea mays TaxID=4577 RepID=A0A1D6HRX1_MAIZE|nr:hypothetical protein ZEAMMB73_Zm00001d018746 [Zea mays]
MELFVLVIAGLCLLPIIKVNKVAYCFVDILLWTLCFKWSSLTIPHVQKGT